MKKVTEEKEASAKENSGTENKKKLNIKVYNVLLLALLGIIGALFVSVIIPAQNATKKYNIAVEAYNKAVEEYNEVAVKTSLVNIDGLLTKADALNDVSESYFAIIKSVINGNNKGKILKDVATLEKMTNVLAENIKVVEQITVPDESWLIERLQSVDGIKETEAITENNDPNGMLNQEDGYVSCIYFSYNKVDDSSVPGETVVDKGTDCGGAIEIYRTLEEAENRVEYLKGFDDTVLYSGSYAIVGTMVIRTSYLLNDEEQYDLTDAIMHVLTKIK